MVFFCYCIKIRLLKFEEDCLKNVGGERFQMRNSFFAVLVFPSHKEPVMRPEFDRP